MGRPKEHGEEMRGTLLAAAEQLLAESGSQGLSIRKLAAAAGTTTRAVYSVFGGKAGVASALYRQTFETIGAYIDQLPETDDPGEDLVQCGTEVFRRYALEHPNLFRLVFERLVVGLEVGPEQMATGLESLGRLRRKVERLAAAGRLGDRSIGEATLQFHSLCQGLASIELRGWLAGVDDPLRVWRDGLCALVDGLTATKRSPAPKRSSRGTGKGRGSRLP